MRLLAAVATGLLLAAGLAGCLGVEGELGAGEGAGQGASDGASRSDGGGDGAGDASSDQAKASASDNGTGGGASGGSDPAGEPANETEDPQPDGDATYRLALSPMRWGHVDLKVVIVPPGYSEPGQVDPFASRFLRAVEDSIQHWQEAIDEHGSSELAGNVTFTTYVVGRDIVSPTEILDVDIYITNPPGGIGLGGFAAYPLSPRCVIANFALPTMDYKWMFMVSAHEFGHCLGMSHPDDHEPWFDLMSYSYINQPSGTPDVELDCVSNLNLMVVHEAFAPAFGRSAASAVEISAGDYWLIDCAERFL